MVKMDTFLNQRNVQSLYKKLIFAHKNFKLAKKKLLMVEKI
jgi:hypothetical protein